MSIKPIEALPPERGSVTRRKMLRDDIMSAISQRITAFEFEGDYNYKYLAQYAREQADFIFVKEVYRPAVKKVREKLKGELRKPYIFPPSQWEYNGRFIKITKRKEEDRNHVYAQIDYDFFDRFEEILEADTRKQYREREERNKKDEL